MLFKSYSTTSQCQQTNTYVRETSQDYYTRINYSNLDMLTLNIQHVQSHTFRTFITSVTITSPAKFSYYQNHVVISHWPTNQHYLILVSKYEQL